MLRQTSSQINLKVNSTITHKNNFVLKIKNKKNWKNKICKTLYNKLNIIKIKSIRLGLVQIMIKLTLYLRPLSRLRLIFIHIKTFIDSHLERRYDTGNAAVCNRYNVGVAYI